MLDIQTEEIRPGVTVIKLDGKLTMGPDSAALESLITGCMDTSCRHLVFDLSNLKQIDSTGIGRFISSYNRLMQVQGSLGMAAAPPVVRQSFRVTRLDTVFKFYETVDAAIEAVPAA